MFDIAFSGALSIVPQCAPHPSHAPPTMAKARAPPPHQGHVVTAMHNLWYYAALQYSVRLRSIVCVGTHHTRTHYTQLPTHLWAPCHHQSITSVGMVNPLELIHCNQWAAHTHQCQWTPHQHQWQ